VKYLSVCSGIEAATVAWHPLGWEAFAYSEIEKFPCKVLAHHYPNTPNLGDMTKYQEWPDAAIDVLVGGTPCQSFSIAGLREGLSDPRGNLMLTYLAIAAKYRPKWLVWENVPGVLSSNGGKDFASLLRGMAELGYGFSYRVLDAQYFGVAQRRRRVFVIGCLRDWRSAAAVLLERNSLSGNPAPSRKAGQEITGAITAGAFSGGAGGRPEGAAANHFVTQGFECGPSGVDFIDTAPTMDARCKDGPIRNQVGASVATLCVSTGQAGAEIGADMAPTLNCNHEAPYVAFPINDMATRHAGTDGSGNQNGKGHGLGIGGPEDPMFTLTKGDKHAVAIPINTQVAMRHEALGEGTGMGIGSDSDPSFTLQAGHHHAVAFSAKDYGADATHDLSPTLRAGGSDKSHANSGNWMAIQQSMQVRRLTPRECERLQGFPDNYTLIEPNTPDGPRYKALGNSMAVPVMRWIGERIGAVEAIQKVQVAA
jgi:DNA (cytosine-5)-methyltransferase 1